MKGPVSMTDTGSRNIRGGSAEAAPCTRVFCTDCREAVFSTLVCRISLVWLVSLVVVLTAENWAAAQDAAEPNTTSPSIATANATVDDPVDDPGEELDAESLHGQVAALIDQLGDASFRRRESAEWQLQRFGLMAFEQLRLAAQNSENVQIASSARYIIESQNILWWLETDSVEVRSYLIDYSSASKDRREQSIMLLGELRTPDAFGALCRLARYERYEDLSKSAALALMEGISELERELDQSNTQHTADSLTRDELVASIRLSIGSSDRDAVRWVRLLADNLAAKDATVSPWSELVQAEDAADGLNDEITRAAKIRFYSWVGSWLGRYAGKDAAIETIKPALFGLVDGQPYSLQTLCVWALDGDMPEIVQELSQNFETLFSGNGTLGYLLAESYLKTGDDVQAAKCAAAASDHVGPSEEVKKLSNNLRMPDIVAQERYQMARQLEMRGLFEWAEVEYGKAIEQAGDYDKAPMREAFAMFYWFGGQHREAAEVLRPLVDEYQQKQQLIPNLDISMRRTSFLGSYYFYDGLAHIDAADDSKARESLLRAMEFDGGNPDVIIAMKQVATTDEFLKLYETALENMAVEFRADVVRWEERLALAVGREQRRGPEETLASTCNQLAWLLGKCAVSTAEAVRLSERSLELKPKYPIYMDTLARCYFSDGQINKAIETQRQAIALAPHERQMKAQLAEFEAAANADTEDP